MDLTDDERELIIAGLFELTITYLDDATKVERCTNLATRLGGGRAALLFGASLERRREQSRAPKAGLWSTVSPRKVRGTFKNVPR